MLFEQRIGDPSDRILNICTIGPAIAFPNVAAGASGGGESRATAYGVRAGPQVRDCTAARRVHCGRAGRRRGRRVASRGRPFRSRRPRARVHRRAARRQPLPCDLRAAVRRSTDGRRARRRRAGPRAALLRARRAPARRVSRAARAAAAG